MTAENSKRTLTAMDDYINKVYTMVLLLIPGACECAGLLYTLAKVLGWLPSVKAATLIIFDITCLLYLAIGIILIKTGKKDGVVKPASLMAGKIFLALLMIIQFNFILYMIPATDFWGFAFFFVILSAFFLDWKLVAVISAEIGCSVVASWFLWGEIHKPAEGEHFYINFLDRSVCLVLSLVSIVVFTIFINKFLVNAKKDEMSRNMEQVSNVLAGVQSISEQLHTAGASLSQISESESASAETLAETSRQLLDSSNLLSQKTNESMSNLTELSKWEDVVTENVTKAEAASKNLLGKSSENEKLLKDLRAINSEVSESMKASTEMAEKLNKAVGEIDAALKLINDISASTKILSVNATIEAARAGAVGKGFAVVASEVGKLANDTQMSLKTIEPVIDRVQKNVHDITAQVCENSEKLETQNAYFTKVFAFMQDMTGLIGESGTAISAMGDAHGKQAEVIRKTVDINESIAESIRSENEQFHSIHTMASGNADNTAKLTAQAVTINGMVDNITELLGSNS